MKILSKAILVSTLFLGASCPGVGVEAAQITFKVGTARLATYVDSIYEQRWNNVARQGLDISCGSAALATILHYHYGDKVSETGLIAGLFQMIGKEKFYKQGGFSLLDLKRVSEALGYDVQGFRLNLEQLVALNEPVLVPLRIRNFKHFVVFRGMMGDRVLLADPSFGNIRLTAFDFMKLWQGVALAISLPPQETPPPEALAVKGKEGETAAETMGRILVGKPEIYNPVRADEF